jgi:hypothetical protein
MVGRWWIRTLTTTSLGLNETGRSTAGDACMWHVCLVHL